MLSIKECLALSSRLQQVSDSARLDCECLLAHVLKKDRTFLYTWPEKKLDYEQQKLFEKLLSRRQKGEPIAHLLGLKEFWSLPFLVDDSTLIPRPETELLVSTTLDLFADKDEPKAVLDLGTGTGVIALSLAKERPSWKVIGVDKYPQTLEVAQKNQQQLNCTNVIWLQSDWFQNVEPTKFDVIISNPPYIDSKDEHLQRGDVRFEPVTALVSDKLGFKDLQTIIEVSPKYLVEGGYLLLEHGYQQGETVCEFMSEQGYSDCRIKKDLSGNPRVSIGRQY